jgi:hypothetical protein
MSGAAIAVVEGAPDMKKKVKLCQFQLFLTKKDMNKKQLPAKNNFIQKDNTKYMWENDCLDPLKTFFNTFPKKKVFWLKKYVMFFSFAGPLNSFFFFFDWGYKLTQKIEESNVVGEIRKKKKGEKKRWKMKKRNPMMTTESLLSKILND